MQDKTTRRDLWAWLAAAFTALAAPIAGNAKTQMTPAQLATTTTPTDPVKLLATEGGGRFVELNLGAGLTRSGTTISATGTQPAPSLMNQVATRQPDGSWAISGVTPAASMQLAVCRNGLRQTPTVDYVRDAADSRRITTVDPWQTTDGVLFDYLP